MMVACLAGKCLFLPDTLLGLRLVLCNPSCDNMEELEVMKRGEETGEGGVVS